MLALMQRGMLMQFSKYTVLKGKYLVPVPPKRSPSAYLLYSIEARQKLQGGSITENAKKISEQWKELPDADKQAYASKAAEGQAVKTKNTDTYNSKYRYPFTAVSARSLIMEEFYKLNKYTNLKEGNEALKQHIQNLNPQQKQTYEKRAAELKAEKQKLRRPFQIPQPVYRSFNSYLRSQRKQDPKIPSKKDLSDRDLQKFRNRYEAQVEKYKEKLQKFASKHEISVSELTKLLNKNKDRNEVLAEKKLEIAEQQRAEVDKLKRIVKESKGEFEKEKKKTTKAANSQVRRSNQQIEKVKNQIKRRTERAQKALEEARKLRGTVSNKSEQVEGTKSGTQ